MRINGKSSMNSSSSKGFTLIEIMIAVAMVALLASIALPSYQNFVVRTNRSDAQDILTRVMFEQERFASRNRTYTVNLAALGYNLVDIGGGVLVLVSENGLYRVTAAVCTANGAIGGGAAIPISRCVRLTATPTPGGYQANDGALTLNSRGAKTDNGVAGGWRER